MIMETLLSKRDQLPLELAIIEPEGDYSVNTWYV